MNRRSTNKNSASLSTANRQVLHWTRSGKHQADDCLAAEEPLEIQVETRPISVTMRTPGHDEELAAGFLLTEGLISERKQIALEAYQLRVDFRAGAGCACQAETGVQLVDLAVCINARVIFHNPRAVKERRLACVARTCVDLQG